MELRQQGLGMIFGLTENQMKCWPGTVEICTQLESHFSLLLGDAFDVIWDILGQDKPTLPVECWRWCFAVIKACKNPGDDGDISIENLYQRLLKPTTTNGAKTSTSKHYNTWDKSHALVAIFAVLCWMTLTLSPTLERYSATVTTDVPEARLFFRLEASLARKGTSIYAAKRPIIKMYRDIREQYGARKLVAELSTLGTDVSNISSVNFYSLYTFGRVHIK
ncbi:hypothetical protein DL98DRAFT_587699 [Cadophora sp. DSE1049]|nr:hypothetical protein DL98DRAFT_587699 [Cadophora sp. DSE1049]